MNLHRKALNMIATKVLERLQPRIPEPTPQADAFTEASRKLAHAYAEAREAIALAAGATPETHVWITTEDGGLDEGVLRRDFLAHVDELPLTPPIAVRYPCVELRRSPPFTFHVVTVNRPPTPADFVIETG